MRVKQAAQTLGQSMRKLGARAKHGLGQLWKPLSITSPAELERFIDTHARLFIRTVVDKNYQPYHQPPAVVYAIITAGLWQHSVDSWHPLLNADTYQQVARGVEQHWLRQINAATKEQEISQAEQKLIQLLLERLYVPNKVNIPDVSNGLWCTLHQHTPHNPTIGQLAHWLQTYTAEWQELVSSSNIISILLIAAKTTDT